jgi:hypothetical protein
MLTISAVTTTFRGTRPTPLEIEPWNFCSNQNNILLISGTLCYDYMSGIMSIFIIQDLK